MTKKRFAVLFLIIAVMIISVCACTSEGKTDKDNPKDDNADIVSHEQAVKKDTGDKAGHLKEETETDKVLKDKKENNTTVKKENKDISQTPDTGEKAPVAAEHGNVTFEDTLFIGDSRTEGLMIYGGISGADFFCAKSMTIDRINNGEAVNVAGRYMSLYDLLSERSYKRVYINMGLNELGWVNIEKFTGEYISLINTVKSKQPGARIYVQALYPVTTAKSDAHPYVNNPQICWYNSNLYELSVKENVEYINTDAPLIDENGALKNDATTDGVHLRSAYCRILAEHIKQISE